MKKIIALFLVTAFSLTALTACKSKPVDATYDVKEVLAKIEAASPVTQPMDLPENDLKFTMELDMADVKSWAGKKSEAANKYADLIVVIEAAEGKIDVVKAALEKMQEATVKTYELYEAGEAQKAKDGRIVVKGNYAVLTILNETETSIDKTIDEAFK